MCDLTIKIKQITALLCAILLALILVVEFFQINNNLKVPTSTFILVLLACDAIN